MSKTLYLAALVAPALLQPQAFADPISGPGRYTVSKEIWGSIYLQNTAITDSGYFDETLGITERLISYGKSKASATTIKLPVSQQNKRIISTSTEAIVITENRPQGKTTFVKTRAQRGGAGPLKYSIERSLSSTKLTVPGDVITISQMPGALTVSGKRGTLRISSSLSNRIFSSAKGKTKILVQADNGLSVTGLPLSAHPYMFHGIFIPIADAGIFIDLWTVAGVINPVQNLIEWTSL